MTIIGRTHDGKVIRSGWRWSLGRWHVLLLPRGRRRDYVCAGESLPPVRFGYFRRSSYNTTLGIFLPALPWIGAWRLIISRTAKWLTRDRDGRRTAETEGLGSKTGQPGPEGHRP